MDELKKRAMEIVHEINTMKNGKADQYLCIIDLGSKAEGKAGVNDTIAQRLLSLSQDKKVADEIYSLGDKMDKHWRDIQKEEGVEA